MESGLIFLLFIKYILPICVIWILFSNNYSNIAYSFIISLLWIFLISLKNLNNKTKNSHIYKPQNVNKTKSNT